MSAPTKAPSKAAKFADAAEALGWTVTREKLSNGGRRVMAQRGNERYRLEWMPNERGNLTYNRGFYSVGHVLTAVPISNTAKVLRDMAAVTPSMLRGLDDQAVLTALAGKTIEWHSDLTKIRRSGVVPRGGMNVKIQRNSAGERILNFIDTFGFRSVKLAQITKVK